MIRVASAMITMTENWLIMAAAVIFTGVMEEFTMPPP
jgi:hypothetical protein